MSDTANDDTAPLASESDTVDPPKMPTPSPQSPRGGDIPQENLLVAADAGEPCIVVGDGDFVAGGRVRLHQARFRDRGGGFGRLVEMDIAVGAGQKLVEDFSAGLAEKMEGDWESYVL